MNRSNLNTGNFESIQILLDTYHSSLHSPIFQFCLIWSESIHILNESIHSVNFTRNITLDLLFFIYTQFLITPKVLNQLQLFSLGLKNSLFINSPRLNTFS